jgi:hypothetical protein
MKARMNGNGDQNGVELCQLSAKWGRIGCLFFLLWGFYFYHFYKLFRRNLQEIFRAASGGLSITHIQVRAGIKLGDWAIYPGPPRKATACKLEGLLGFTYWKSIVCLSME